jgi:hypothetical protein
MMTIDAGVGFRGMLALLVVGASMAGCTNDVQFFDEDNGCEAPPPPADGWCPPAWQCVDGEWLDYGGACPEPACPVDPPGEGTTCQVNGQSCGYEIEEEYGCDEYGFYNVNFQCHDNQWTQTSNYCQPEPICPDTAPVVGTSCDGWSEAYYCDYSVETACGSAQIGVYCGYDGVGSVWESSYSEELMCEQGCTAYGSEVGCAATEDCRWLVPGCDEGTNALTEAGCFPADECQATSCGAGQSCETVTYDPCHNASCNACGAETSVCL